MSSSSELRIVSHIEALDRDSHADKAEKATREEARAFIGDHPIDSHYRKIGMQLHFVEEAKDTHEESGEILMQSFPFTVTNRNDPRDVLLGISTFREKLDLTRGDKAIMITIVRQPRILGALTIYEDEVRRIIIEREGTQLRAEAGVIFD